MGVERGICQSVEHCYLALEKSESHYKAKRMEMERVEQRPLARSPGRRDPTLRRSNLRRENELGPQGAELLAPALAGLTSLKRLGLRYEPTDWRSKPQAAAQAAPSDLRRCERDAAACAAPRWRERREGPGPGRHKGLKSSI